MADTESNAGEIDQDVAIAIIRDMVATAPAPDGTPRFYSPTLARLMDRDVDPEAITRHNDASISRATYDRLKQALDEARYSLPDDTRLRYVFAWLGDQVLDTYATHMGIRLRHHSR